MSRGDRIYIYICYCKARENKIVAWSVRFNFFLYIFFPGEKVNFTLFGLLGGGEGKGSKRLCLENRFRRKKKHHEYDLDIFFLFDHFN